MKAYNTILLVLAMFFINTMVISNTTNTNELKIELIGERLNEEVKRPILNDFLEHMGFLESSNNYRKVNTLGYLGKYQFGKSTLETLGYGDIPTEDFVNSPKLQEKVMIKNLKYNKKVLVNYIENYEGECVGGVIITESGLLGAAHLAGAGSVMKFLRKGHDPQDSYGTKLSKYLIKFSNYDLNLD
jgi:hypothetical protein